MNETVRQRARELGFEDCRITTASSPESASHFLQWLAEGRHGEMAYLERNAAKRVQPQQILPGARSIIMLASSYAEAASLKLEACHQGTDSRIQSSEIQGSGFRGQPSLREGESSAAGGSGARRLFGFVARYARGCDYHEVLGERLKALTLFVNELGGKGARSLWYVDTGPVLERDLAQRAGLGFIGKHTNLISRRFGNWIFLSEIITSLELKPDAPARNRCGSCVRCIAACPTRAIKAPFQLDARRCISCLTIELKGPIPVELRPAIGNRIFGCDDCLAVCPWNRFAREGQIMKTHTASDLGASNLLELLSLDEEGFKLRFAGTPILRARRRGLLRNVCVALGNVGDDAALPALQRASREAEPLIAEHAKWAIDQIGGRREP
jgi:epoxyqueuosine reductase